MKNSDMTSYSAGSTMDTNRGERNSTAVSNRFSMLLSWISIVVLLVL